MIYKRGRCKLGTDRKCKKCGKRGACGVYWYKFMWIGKLVRKSTKQGNDKVARQMESAHRTSLAKGEVGIRDRKLAPTLAQFVAERFESWARASVAPATWCQHYRGQARALKAYMPLASRRLDEITSEHIAGFAAHRRSQGLEV